jgi:hypothetical protein
LKGGAGFRFDLFYFCRRYRGIQQGKGGLGIRRPDPQSHARRGG